MFLDGEHSTIPESGFKKSAILSLCVGKHARSKDDGIFVAELCKSNFRQAFTPIKGKLAFIRCI